MTNPDAYTKHLLWMAVDECRGRGWNIEFQGASHVIVSRSPSDHTGYGATTLARALVALLSDLGVEVPERASGRQVNAAYLSAVPLEDAAPCSFAVGRLRDLYARAPLTVLDLLEGGGS